MAPARWIAGSLLVLAVAGCAANNNPAPQPAGFLGLTQFIDTPGASPGTSFQAFDGSNLVIYDVNHDGKPEIVGSNDNLHEYVIDPQAGRVVAELQGTHPGGNVWEGRELDGPAVADVLGDGGTEIAVDDGASYLSLWQYKAASSTAAHFAFKQLWEHYVDARAWDPDFNATHQYNTLDIPANEGHPFLADVDHSGQMTVFGQADNIAAHVAYYANGTRRWFSDPPVDNNAGAIVADLNGDGKLEAIFASDGGPVYVEDAQTGAPIWTYDTRCIGGVYQGDGSNCDFSEVGSVTLSPTVADLLGDGTKEICFGDRSAVSISDLGWYGNTTQLQVNVDASHAILFCLTHDGHLLWTQQYVWLNPHIAMHPVPFDVNGDGVKDLIWEDWNTVGHIPGNWQTTTRGPNLFALDGRTGDLLWRHPLQTGWSNKDVSLADVYGDGRQLLLAIEYGPSGDDGVSIIDPHNGQHVGWAPLKAGWLATRGPIVADLYGDGKMEVVVPVMRNATSSDWCFQMRPDIACREGAIEILATNHHYSSAFSDSFTWSLAAATKK